MPDYRVLILDQHSAVLALETYEAADDKAGWEYVRRWFSAAAQVELWCGTRQLVPLTQRQACG